MNCNLYCSHIPQGWWEHKNKNVLLYSVLLNYYINFFSPFLIPMMAHHKSPNHINLGHHPSCKRFKESYFPLTLHERLILTAKETKYKVL